MKIKIDTIFVKSESKPQKNVQYKGYEVRQTLYLENGDSLYFKPGFIYEVNNKLYFDMQGFELYEK